MNTTFIMCAGEARRFHGELKQLLSLLNGTTILGRQLSQLEEEQVCVVSHSQTIIDYANSMGVQCIIPSNRATVCNSILSTQYRWGDRVTILLGDVIYSNKVINDILSCEEPIMFFGDEWEVYGVSFSDHETAISAFEIGAATSWGKIRYAYRKMIGVAVDREETPKLLRSDPVFHYVDCWVTRDCDSQGHYDNIVRELLNRGILDRE